MSATLLQLAYLLLAAGSAALWGTALFLGAGDPTRKRSITSLLIAGGLVALALRWAVALLLLAVDVGFAQEKVVLGLPLSTVASIAAAVLWWMPVPASGMPPWRRVLLTGTVAAAAYGAAAELLLTQVVGAPMPLWAGAATAACVVGGAVATALALNRGAGTTRRPLAAAAAATAIVVVGALVVGWMGASGPGALTDEGFSDAHGAHGESDSPGGQEDTTSVTDLVGTADAEARVIVADLHARLSDVTLPSGRQVTAWTFGELGGPALEATVGDRMDVRLVNDDIEEGVTVHWHGYPVPNAVDGVAGVTQDSVRPGEEFRGSFPVTTPGTYWYHTHQRGSKGVVRGLYGTFVVQPASGPTEDIDVVLPVHTQSGAVLLGASDVLESREAEPGNTVRVRLVNTDQVPQSFAVEGAPFHVVAIDATDVSSRELADRAIVIPAGGRVDVVFTMPEDAVRIATAASRAAGLVFVVPGGSADVLPPVAPPTAVFDPLSDLTSPPSAQSGEREAAAAAIDAALEGGDAGFDVERTYVLDRLPRLVGGLPAYGYTVDGDVYPHIEPTVVREGDTVRIRVVNRSFETHPMHPHGHAVRVLSVNGIEPAQPLWLDTFDVGPGQVWEVAMLADNPGIWMDHCHNLEHASLGMVTHLAYAGVSTPFEQGGAHGNAPE